MTFHLLEMITSLLISEMLKREKNVLESMKRSICLWLIFQILFMFCLFELPRHKRAHLLNI